MSDKQSKHWLVGALLLTTACGADADFSNDEGTLDWDADSDHLQQPLEGGTKLASGQGAVMITVQGEGGECTGAIIGRRTVITVAHCANNVGYGTKNLNVKVEYWDNDKWWCLSAASNTQARCSSFEPGKAWVNPAYEGTSGNVDKASNDFAVIMMNRDFTYIGSGHNMGIMETPKKDQIAKFTAHGYGWISDTNSNSADEPYGGTFSLETLTSNYYYSLATSQRLCGSDSGAPQFDRRGSSRLVFGLHVRRSPSNGECAETGVEQWGVVVAPHIGQIEKLMGRSCRHYNTAEFGKVADCW